jgi:transposase InsO family protein
VPGSGAAARPALGREFEPELTSWIACSTTIDCFRRCALTWSGAGIARALEQATDRSTMRR